MERNVDFMYWTEWEMGFCMSGEVNGCFTSIISGVKREMGVLY